MTGKWTTEDDAALAQVLDTWHTPAASPWLASRVANAILAGGVRPMFLPWRMKTRVAALALAVVVGWGIGMTVAAPEASADGLELAELLW
jgi:hypothetical protein